MLQFGSDNLFDLMVERYGAIPEEHRALACTILAQHHHPKMAVSSALKQQLIDQVLPHVLDAEDGLPSIVNEPTLEGLESLVPYLYNSSEHRSVFFAVLRGLRAGGLPSKRHLAGAVGIAGRIVEDLGEDPSKFQAWRKSIIDDALDE